MRCSVCGKEFGGGANCQNCGVDRVTGLGNYSGYNNPSGSPGRDSSNIGGSNASNMMVCYACGGIIPTNSTYCPNCGKQLFVTCPKCGHEYSSQYPICNKCGTNREIYKKQMEVERQNAIRREEEKQRKQKEWEQSPEGRKEAYERYMKGERNDSMGTITTIGGGILLLVLLDYIIDENWLNQDIIGINIRFALIFFISFGASYLIAKALFWRD